jgi:chromate transport protein ChrA
MARQRSCTRVRAAVRSRFIVLAAAASYGGPSATIPATERNASRERLLMGSASGAEVASESKAAPARTLGAASGV